jgi:hypothetical protein
VRVHPDVLVVAVNTKLTGVAAPLVGTDRMFHLPATSARLIGAGAIVVVELVEVVEDAIALVESTAALSFLAHAERTAALQHIAMRVVRCSVNM